MSNTFGRFFRVTCFGESHGTAVGAVVDGCPPGLSLTESDIQVQLDRRKPGQSDLTTSRREGDQVALLSGVENGLTLGTPIGLLVYNKDHRPQDYQEANSIPRPSHADYTTQLKYGIRASSGGGRSSARETIGRVAAGAIAEKVLQESWGIEIVGWVSQVGDIHVPDPALINVTRGEVDKSAVRCPDPGTAARMIDLIHDIKKAGDSIGGVITCVCRNVPPGLGDPVFDKLEAVLAQAMLSIPGSRGFEIGSGFQAASMRGSQHNDPFVKKGDRLGTLTNHSGGIQGGISNGETIVFRVAFKPPATIGIDQETVDIQGMTTVLKAKGRHDPCVAPRAVPIVEAMAALVIVDSAFQQKSIRDF